MPSYEEDWVLSVDRDCLLDSAGLQSSIPYVPVANVTVDLFDKIPGSAGDCDGRERRALIMTSRIMTVRVGASLLVGFPHDTRATRIILNEYIRGLSGAAPFATTKTTWTTTLSFSPLLWTIKYGHLAALVLAGRT
jgi:hypothetical protein